MFVSQERDSNKRIFQKPNILRRKTKAPVRLSGASNAPTAIESQTGPYASAQGTIINNLQLENRDKYTYVKPVQSVQKDTSNVLYRQVETTDLKDSSQNVSACNENALLVNIVNYNEEIPVQSSVNVESFFNNGKNRENVMLFAIDPMKEMQSIVIIDDESQKNGLSSQTNNDLITNMVPLSAVSTPKIKAQVKAQKPSPTTVISPQQLFENTTLAPTKYKCDIPDCKKQFRSEKKWKRHKNSHKRDGIIRVPRQVAVECPVRKVDADGTEQRCGKIYLVREQLAKHLSEDHTPEDAPYRCDQCGRQFFWASGLRAHARSHSVQPRPSQSLACGWPGCGRVFALPCRLREHARAHTGDKPYSCRFPNCSSSFRSASKLERHARRHTGLRRHACAACGRAFLRREHLRDHAARAHHDKPKRAHLITCPHRECEQTFKDADTLQEHISDAHAAEQEEPVTPAVEADPATCLLKDNLDYIFMVEEATDTPQDIEEKGDEDGGDEVEETAEAEAVEGAEAAAATAASRAARTHCPWPLAPRYSPATHLALDEDATVEQPEGSESNIYTVRSDLFLHGNVLINEDSVQMGNAVENAEVATETSAPNDELGLGLLEHPHIDLMQEEMMFTVWQ